MSDPNFALLFILATFAASIFLELLIEIGREIYWRIKDRKGKP